MYELKWEPFAWQRGHFTSNDQAAKRAAQEGRFSKSDSVITRWMALHTIPPGRGPAVVVDELGAMLAATPALGATRSCVWAALTEAALAGFLSAPLHLTGVRASSGELSVRAHVSLDIAACVSLYADGGGDEALAIVLRHVANTRPILAPLPNPPPPAPPPQLAAGYCGVVGCPAHRTDAGEAAEKAEADAFSLTRMYADCTNDCCFGGPSAGVAPQPAGLLAQLHSFQRATLAWALSREAQPRPLPLHPQVRALKTGGGQTLYWDDGGGALGGESSKKGRRFGLSSPVDPPLDFRGGIIADELGLGKTVEVLALILSTKGQAPQPPAPGAPGSATFVAKGSTYRLSADTLALVETEAAEKLGLRRSGRRGAGRTGPAAAAAAEEHVIYVSSATLVVVPSPLLDQWRREIKQHVAPSGLRVCVLATKQEAAAEEASQLARFDLVLTTTEVVGAHTQWADPTGSRPGPLLRVHWLRLVVD